MKPSRRTPARIRAPRPSFVPTMVGVEGYRRLRSDGTPNWVQRLPERIGETGLVASKPPITVSSSAPIMEALESIARHKVRGLVVTSGQSLYGVVMSTDLVNYLGGGGYYKLVTERHNGNIYRALVREKVSSVTSTRFPIVGSREPLSRAVELLLSSRAGFVVVVDGGRPYGVITEKDLIRHLFGKRVEISVEDAMTTPVLYIGEGEPMKSAAETLTRYSIRRLPVVSDSGEVKGVLTARGYLEYFGSHEAFKKLSGTSLEDVLETPVSALRLEEPQYIEERRSVSEALEVMVKSGSSSLLVVDEDYNVTGILTERDALVAILS